MIFTPNTEIKDELARTPVSITCYDRYGNIVKQVNSDDNGAVEDPSDKPSDEGGPNQGPGEGDGGSEGDGDVSLG